MMDGYDAYNGYNEKQGHGEDPFAPKQGNSIVSAFDAFRTSMGQGSMGGHC